MIKSISSTACRFFGRVGFAFLSMLAALLVVTAFAGASQAWASQNAQELKVGTTAATDPPNIEFPYEANGDYVSVCDRTAGTVDFDPKTCTLTLSNLKASDVEFYHPKSAVTVILVGTNATDHLIANGTAATIKGPGSLAGTIEGRAEGNTPLTIAGGTVTGNINVSIGGSLVVSGGKINGNIWVDGPVTIKGGVIKGNSGLHGIECTSFKMTGGLVNFSNTNTGVQVDDIEGKSCNFTMSGGEISVTSPSTGIYLAGGNLTLTGGTISVTKADFAGIWVERTVYKGKKYGGKVKLTGGTLSSTIADNPNDGYAVHAVSMTNRSGTLRTIAGLLAPGAVFKKGKNTYKVAGQECVTLTEYGNSAKKVLINKVKYGKSTYKVTGIGKQAFNTKAGKKVKSITFKSNIMFIGAKAFADTKSLRMLHFIDDAIWVRGVFNGHGKYKSFSLCEGCSVSKSALSKAGKNGGKDLTIKFGSGMGMYSSEMVLFQKFMRSKGMPSKAKIVTY